MSDILTREEFEDLLLSSVDENLGDLSDRLDKLLGVDAALRACIQQAVLDVEKAPHGGLCQFEDAPRCTHCSQRKKDHMDAAYPPFCPDARGRPETTKYEERPARQCNCWKVAAIAGLKERAGREMKRVTLRVSRSMNGHQWYASICNDNAESIRLLAGHDANECKMFFTLLFDRSFIWEEDSMGDFRFVIEVLKP